MQRDGVPYQGKNVCFVKIDPAHMIAKEITIKDAEKLLPEDGAAKTSKAEKPTTLKATDGNSPIKRPLVLKIKNPKDE